MHNRFDQFVKRLVREGFSPGGQVETEAEVTPDSLRIDVWFWPDAARARKVLAPLGLFGRIGRTSCTLEPNHYTPSGEQVADHLAKHRFFCRELARRTPRPPAPMQWIVSSGRPSAALVGLRFRRSRRGPGIYDGPPLLRTRVVVASELPRTRDTVLVRLMGAGKTLARAIADLGALPDEAPERRLALPLLVRLRLEVPADPAKQTEIDREILMTAKEIDKYLKRIEHVEELCAKAAKEGREEGVANSLLVVYRTRFGAPPAAVVAAVEGERDPATLQRWLEIVATRSVEEAVAALRRPRKGPASRSTAKRRSASPRRAAPSR